jgi:hypothetical protein
MVEEGRQQSWSEYLDSEKENKLFVRFVFSPDFKEVEEFAVIYLTTIEGETFEVIRFDCSGRETVNVHQFFSRQPEKHYLNREKNFATLQEFIENIRKNWHIYKAKFLEK